MSACAALSEALWRLPEKRTVSTRPVVGGEGEVGAPKAWSSSAGSADLARAHHLAGPRAKPSISKVRVPSPRRRSECAAAGQPAEKLDRAAGGLHVRYGTEGVITMVLALWREHTPLSAIASRRSRAMVLCSYTLQPSVESRARLLPSERQAPICRESIDGRRLATRVEMSATPGTCSRKQLRIRRPARLL